MKQQYTFTCPKCGKIFELLLTESEYLKGKHRKFCSVQCANSRTHSDTTKKKISSSLQQQKKECKCIICGNKFIQKHRETTCSSECLTLSKSIKTYTKYFQLDANALGTKNIYVELNKLKNLLYDLYWNKRYSLQQIAKQFNYPKPNSLYTLFKRLEIPIKTNHEALIDSYIEGRAYLRDSHQNYKCGWHTSWDGIECYLRSSYELNYAKILDSQKIHYETEYLRIKYFDEQLNEYRCAIPDFYLPETNTIVEIKSTWTLDIKNMQDKFKEYKKQGYNTLLYVNGKEYNLNV